MAMSKLTILMVLSVCIITPFANDIFIASFPSMQLAFHSDKITLIMTSFMLGLAISQLFYGPLLDRFGRKVVLLGGLVIYCIASAFILFSGNILMLLIVRFFQGVGVCSTIVSAMAIARDVYKKEELVKAMAMIMAIIGVCPVLAPLFGSFLQNSFGWRASFVLLLVLGIVYFFVVLFLYKESIKEKNMHALKLSMLYKNYISLLQKKAFTGYILVSACSYGVLFSYAAASSILIIKHFHYSVMSYGILFALNASAIVLMSILTPRLSARYGISRMVVIGCVFILLGALFAILMGVLIGENIYTLMLPMWIATIGIGMIRPSASAGAIALAEHKITGSAAALFNFSSFVGGSISTYLVANFTLTVVNYGIFAFIIACIAICLSLCVYHAEFVHKFRCDEIKEA